MPAFLARNLVFLLFVLSFGCSINDNRDVYTFVLTSSFQDGFEDTLRENNIYYSRDGGEFQVFSSEKYLAFSANLMGVFFDRLHISDQSWNSDRSRKKVICCYSSGDELEYFRLLYGENFSSDLQEDLNVTLISFLDYKNIKISPSDKVTLFFVSPYQLKVIMTESLYLRTLSVVQGEFFDKSSSGYLGKLPSFSGGTSKSFLHSNFLSDENIRSYLENVNITIEVAY